MGKKMIAEFVESKQIHDTLVDMGVDFLQGYYIARPWPIEHLLMDIPHNVVEDCGVYLVHTT